MQVKEPSLLRIGKEKGKEKVQKLCHVPLGTDGDSGEWLQMYILLCTERGWDERQVGSGSRQVASREGEERRTMDTKATGQRQALRSYNMCADTEVRLTSTFVLAYVCGTHRPENVQRRHEKR